ncbi:MAG: ATP-binding protein [Bacteroidia bacterium]|nr:ATP-binding protein [Bacteroidia bacterium]
MRKLYPAEKKERTEMEMTTEPTNLLGNIEKIIELSENSELNKNFFDRAKPYIDYVEKVLGISEMAAVFFAFFVDNTDSRYTYTKDLAQYFKCRKIRIMQYGNIFSELENKRLVRCYRGDNTPGYRIPKEVITALSHGKNIEPRKFSNLTQEELFEYLDELFEEKTEDEILFTDLKNELFTLMDANPHLELSKKISKCFYSTVNKVLLLYFFHLFVNKYDDRIGFHDLESVFERMNLRNITRSLRDGDNELIVDESIENCKEDGFSDANYYKLTDKVKKELLGEDKLKKRETKIFDKKFILHNTIKNKKLYFDPPERTQIDKLTDLLKPQNFTSVQKRLSENGLRNGFACLFYGAPGTGKTETVYQLARQTGRNILPVNVSEIKSMWVGETEKNIKKLFDEYRENVAQTENAPILLFNEADAILGTRLETVRSVDKMENAMQNIILQEMENLNGIMIATTNLTKNLDKAFERRFIYKIEFFRPTLSSKMQIWQAMLPNLSVSDVEELANKYDLSGGQIENIVRKSTVEHILSGKLPSLKIIHELCQNERVNESEKRQRIGFY